MLIYLLINYSFEIFYRKKKSHHLLFFRDIKIFLKMILYRKICKTNACKINETVFQVGIKLKRYKRKGKTKFKKI